ncbi:MAG TPA: hypothetical protein VEK84_02045 [Terriglobales bacterium]|nr:hypothetical protein [Terriglobales bacterium]
MHRPLPCARATKILRSLLLLLVIVHEGKEAHVTIPATSVAIFAAR